MSLKNPGELFERKSPSINVNATNHIKEEFNKVEEIRKQLNDVSSSLNNSLTEVVDKNLNFLSNDYSDQLDKFNNKINSFKEEINNQVDAVRKTNLDLRAEITIVEQRQNKINRGAVSSVISQIKEEVLSDVQNILLGDVANNIKKVDEKVDIIRDSYKQTLNEGLLNEPPSTNNSDPLTPLDQKFATIDDLNTHYNLFLNRVQQQLATLGGGGETKFQYLDDIVGVATNLSDYNGKFLKVDTSQPAGKNFVFETVSGGGGVSDGDKGHITVSNSGSIWTIDDNVVTDQQLNDTGVSAGSYTVANITVDAQGRLTAASNGDSLNIAGISTFNEDVKFTGNNTNMRWNHDTSDLTLFNATRLVFGDNEDFQIWHGGTHTFLKNSETGGDLRIRGDKILLKRSDDAGKYLEATKNQDVKLFYNEVEKFATTLQGVQVSGITSTTHLNSTGISTFRNGVNLLGLLHTNDDVNFTGDAYNLSWDKSDNALEFSDNAKATFGAGTDLEIYSNGTKGIVGGAVSFTSDIDVSDSIFVANNIKHLGDTDTYIEFTADKLRFLTGGKEFVNITQSGASSVVINEQPDYDCDFRVEGLADEHLIFTDAATDKVGIGSAIPRSKLDVNGDVYVGTSQATGVVLTSPNGTKYRLVVANDGTLSTTAV